MPNKKRGKTIEAKDIIMRFNEINEDLKSLEKTKLYIENNDATDSLNLLSLLEVKIQKRKKYLKELQKTKVIVSSNF